jgi:hypothetical protein
MPPLDPLTTLRALKGAPLSCLFALLLAHQPVTARWLSAATGYGNQAITTALSTLEQFRYAVCDSHRSAWRLAEGVQLALPFGPDLIADHGNHDSVPAAATTAIVESQDLRCSSSHPDHEIHDSDYAARLAALAHYGIRQPTAGALAALEWCTPAYVAAMAGQIKNRFSAGLLVHKIRMHDLDDICPAHDESNRRRYAGWERRSD